MEMHKNSILVEIGQIENICFVVMPFDSLFQTQYERVVRPAIEELGLKCVRGDEIYSRANIMSDIWKSIRRSRVIVAELTGRNPNVFYEIGLAHALGKPIILLTRNEDDVPFDLKALRYRYYDVNDPYWGENLRGAIQSMVQNVLDQTEFSTYLEGITVNLEIPEPPQKVDITSKVPVSLPDISGVWQGTWKPALWETEHHGSIFITQQGEKLSGTMSVSYASPTHLVVIQEILTGSIKGLTIRLNGVSYTYVMQGTSSSYSLDNFDLQLSSDGKKMEGVYKDSVVEGKAIFIKQESGE